MGNFKVNSRSQEEKLIVFAVLLIVVSIQLDILQNNDNVSYIIFNFL